MKIDLINPMTNIFIEIVCNSTEQFYTYTLNKTNVASIFLKKHNIINLRNN